MSHPQHQATKGPVSTIRIFFFFLLIGLTCADCSPVQAQGSAAVRIVYSVDSARDGRFVSNVLLTNMTPSPISNWTMSFDMQSVVTDIEHVVWSRFGTSFDIQGAGWTHSIEPGEMVWFTISGVHTSGPVEVPTACFFNGIGCTIEPAPQPDIAPQDASKLQLSAWISKAGATTYDGQILIQNPTDDVFEDWTLVVTSSSLIVSMEQVDWSRSGSSYSISGTGWTSKIPAHGFVWFGFKGVHGGAPELPTGCIIEGIACDFIDAFHLVDTPKMNVSINVEWVEGDMFTAYMFVENTGTEHLDFWKLKFDMTNRITGMDGVQWSRSGNTYSVIGDGATRRVLAGKDVWFTVTGVLGDGVEPPTNCTINARTCTIKATGILKEQDPPAPPDSTGVPTGGGGGGGPSPTCDAGGPQTSLLPDINFRFLSVTSDRYIALVEISNNTDGLILGWKIGFSLIDGMTVTRFWNGLMTFNDPRYDVTNTVDNECIGPGETVSFGFEGGHNGTFAEPIGCQFDTRSCIFQKRTSVATEAEQDPVPASFQLETAYPNPFNPTATIHFSVDRSQRVLMELWDIQGRLVRKLFDRMAPAGQRIATEIDGSGLASGLYLVRMRGADGRSATQKVILQK